MNVSALRDKLTSKVSIGTWMQIPSSIVANILSRQSFDWVVVDLEHGRFDNFIIGDLFNTIKSNNCLPFARLLSPCCQSEISSVLDAGAAGLIFPKIESLDQSRAIYNFSRLPPAGSRGVSFCHANNYGLDFSEYIQSENFPFLVGMIESSACVHNLQEIITADIFDAFIVGPYDLSASLGVTGDFTNSIFLNTLDTIYNILISSNVPFGVHIVYPSANELNKSLERGCTFIPYGIDTTFLSTVEPTF